MLIDQITSANKNRLTRDLALDEIAACAGTSREVVCRVLDRLLDRWLTRITRAEFQLAEVPGAKWGKGCNDG